MCHTRTATLLTAGAGARSNEALNVRAGFARFLSRASRSWIGLHVLIGLAGCAALPVPTDRTASKFQPASNDTHLGRLVIASSPDHTLTGVRLLPTGPFALSTRAALIRRAQRTLDLQYYLFQKDSTGLYLMGLLHDAADRGVRVRLLLDDMYTVGMDDLLAGLSTHPNVEVRLFNPFSAGRQSMVTRFLASALDFDRINHRMHNKLFIADGAFAVVGGRNIADSYFSRDASQNFADMDAMLVGAAVEELGRAFDSYWNSEFAIPSTYFMRPLGFDAAVRFRASIEQDSIPREMAEEKADVLGYGPVVDELDQPRLHLIWGRAEVWVDPTEKVWSCRPTPEGSTAPHLHTVRLEVETLLEKAKKEVTLSSPYLVPGHRGMQLFEETARRGVAYKILTNSLAATDEPLVHWGYMRYRRRMLNLGMELYELSATRAARDRGFGLFGSRSLGRLHAKMAVVDDEAVFIGSMNFDPRSDALNTEVGVLIRSPELAREVLHLMSLDKLLSSYRLRVDSRSRKIEWIGIDDSKEVVQQSEPDASFAIRAYLWLFAPFVSEGML
jgi:putative cardiolipin synthase